MRRRVVVTGIGWITPMGVDVDAAWERLKAGDSCVGPTTIFNASNYPTQISAEVRDWDVDQVGEDLERWKHVGAS